MDFLIIGDSKYVDERLNFIVTGLPEVSHCKIKLKIQYSWCNCPSVAYGIYESDCMGIVNLEKVAPIRGSYRGIDSMGLFAACKERFQIVHKRSERDYTKEYLQCKFTISCNGVVVEKLIVRHFTNSEIICDRITHPFVGYYFYNPTQMDSSPVLLLGGSEGTSNPMLPIAACLANKGLDVLSLQYFSPQNDPNPVETLPVFLRLIPIEYVDLAIEWLCEKTKKNNISIMGYSKGAELSLVTASFNRRINKVVAISPSAYVWQGIFAVNSSWSYKEKPIPYLRLIPIFLLMDLTKNLIFRILTLPQGFYISYKFSRILMPDRYKEKARIKVENSEASFMLIAGEMDSVWDSVAAVGILEKKLIGNRNERVQCKIYKGAGHYFYAPFIFGQETVGGGRNKRVLSEANENSWKEITYFLKS